MNRTKSFWEKHYTKIYTFELVEKCLNPFNIKDIVSINEFKTILIKAAAQFEISKETHIKIKRSPESYERRYLIGTEKLLTKTSKRFKKIDTQGLYRSKLFIALNNIQHLKNTEDEVKNMINQFCNWDIFSTETLQEFFNYLALAFRAAANSNASKQVFSRNKSLIIMMWLQRIQRFWIKNVDIKKYPFSEGKYYKVEDFQGYSNNTMHALSELIKKIDNKIKPQELASGFKELRKFKKRCRKIL